MMTLSLPGASSSARNVRPSAGVHLQQVERVPRHEAALRSRSAPFAPTSVAPVAFDRGEPLEHGVLLPPVEEGRRCDREAAELLHDLVHAHERLGVRVRQRSKEDAVDDAEDGAGGADAERQREDRDDREAGSPGS